VIPSHRGSATAFHGLARGKTVDEEISHWAETREFMFAPHPYTVKLMAAFKTWNWVPVHGQYVVGSLRWKKGTAVDIIVEDPNDKQKWILIEVKCGMVGYFDKADGMLASPLHATTCSGRHLAFLQLVLTRILFLSTCRHPISKCYVVRVFDDGVARYHLPAWCDVAHHDMMKRLNAV
jgi:hypothetical protein